MWSAPVAILLMLAGCTHTAIRGSQPDVRRVGHDGREIEVDAAIGDPAPLLEELMRRGMPASAIWAVPGEPAIRLAIVERPATGAGYGPQLVAIGLAGDARVLHESRRLYDDDFVHPTFFRFSDRTLVLAD